MLPTPSFYDLAPLLPKGRAKKENMSRNDRIKRSVKDILWMARRYADGRQTYAVDMFNNAYDLLRDEFGEDIDPKDPTREQNHPYAEDGNQGFNKDIKDRKYFVD